MGSRDRPVPQVQPGRDPTMGVLDTDRMKVLEALERCQAIVENQVVPHLQGLRHPVSGYLAALTQSQWAVEAMEAARAKKLQADAEHERERINHDRRDVSSLSSSVTPLATPSPSGRQSARQQATPVSASAPGSSSSSPLTGHRTPSPVDDQGPPRQRARHS